MLIQPNAYPGTPTTCVFRWMMGHFSKKMECNAQTTHPGAQTIKVGPAHWQLMQ